MSLNSIHLGTQLLTELYPHHLIEGTTSVPEKEAKPAQTNPAVKNTPAYLGKNGRKILVLVSHHAVPYLPDDELNFLTSVLSACKLSMADIAIANMYKTDPDEIAGLIAEQATKVLLFGLEPGAIDLPINFPQFQIQQFSGRSYLHAPTLSELEIDKEAKKLLWGSLKKMFDLS